MLLNFLKQHQNYFIIILLTIIMSPLYLFQLNSLPASFHGDEAETAFQAITIMKNHLGIIGTGWYGLPLLSFVPHEIFMLFLGNNILADRLGSVIFGIISLPIFFLFIKDFFNKNIAGIATLLLGTSHLWIALSRLGITYVQSAFFVILASYLFFRALKNHKPYLFIFTGLILGLSTYSNFAVRMLPLLILPFILLYLITFKQKLKLKMINIFLLLLSSFIIFLPQANYYLHHLDKISSRENSVFVLSKITKEWTGYTKMTNQQIIIEQTKRTFNIFAGDNSTQYGYKGQLLDYISICLLLIGIIYTIKNIKQFKYQYILFWFFLAILGQVLTSIPPPIFLPRFVVGLPVIYIFISLGISALTSRFDNPKTQTLSKFIVIIIVITFVYSNLVTYFVSYPNQINDHYGRSATKLGNFLNSLKPNYLAYFNTDPNMSAEYRVVDFLSPKGEKFDLSDIALLELTKNAVLINKINSSTQNKQIIFIIYPDHISSLNLLSKTFPRGNIINFKDDDFSEQFYIFKVNNI